MRTELVCLLSTGLALLACNPPHADAPAASGATTAVAASPAAAPAPSPPTAPASTAESNVPAAPHAPGRIIPLSGVVSPRDARLRTAVTAFLERHLYLRWAPDSTDDSAEGVCNDGEADYLNAMWGLARARPVEIWLNSAETRAVVDVEVVRVVSVEDDNETSNGRYAQADMMIVAPALDTLQLDFRLDEQAGRWVQCAPVDAKADGVSMAVSLTGPPRDTLVPRRKIGRRIPAEATWARVRELADSVARAGSP